eukprot:TRINITY_DN9907_c0_g1_i1.p1 TRINITY_DN9907_c0_g1~~TRINITY_DN9907_c0_g1_i1.p1  ORF type:complete len:135 (-),score=28.04 TRINITY_DN9907_c0_g1_i1:94-498(-)
MVIYHLQNSEQNNPTATLGELLISFFDFYGNQLDTAIYGVSVKSRSLFKKSDHGWDDGQHQYISIEDPQDITNDVGKKTFQIGTVKSYFQSAYQSLTNDDAPTDLPHGSYLSRILWISKEFESRIGQKLVNLSS